LGFDISRIWRLVLEKSSERKRKKESWDFAAEEWVA
jgi:hypothetical protein